jgi:hypothetical protein
MLPIDALASRIVLTSGHDRHRHHRVCDVPGLSAGHHVKGIQAEEDSIATPNA